MLAHELPRPSNLIDKTALYTFPSIVFGTCLVQPHTVDVRLRWSFLKRVLFRRCVDVHGYGHVPMWVDPVGALRLILGGVQ